VTLLRSAPHVTLSRYATARYSLFQYLKKAQPAKVLNENKTKHKYTDVLACRLPVFIRAQSKTQQHSSFCKNTTQQKNLSNAIKKTCSKHTQACRSKSIAKHKRFVE